MKINLTATNATALPILPAMVLPVTGTEVLLCDGPKDTMSLLDG